MAPHPVKAALKEKGEPQSWLAERLGITPQSLSAILKGETFCDYEKAELIAQHVGLTADAIMRWHIAARHERAGLRAAEKAAKSKAKRKPAKRGKGAA